MEILCIDPTFGEVWEDLDISPKKEGTELIDWNDRLGLTSTIDKDYTAKGRKDLLDLAKKRVYHDSDYLQGFKITPSLDYTDDICVFLEGNEPAAMCAVNEQLEPGHIWITAIEVAKDYRGYGLGKQLVEYCKSLGADLIGVSEKNEVAKKLYTDCGFVEVGKCADGAARLWLPNE